MLALVELIAQWVNSAFFVIPNAVLLARPCGFFSELVGECCFPTLVRTTILHDIRLEECPTLQYNPMIWQS